MEGVLVRPLSNRVIIDPDQPAASRGGIILPDRSREQPQTGFVVAVGPGLLHSDGHRVPMSVRIGQRVLYQRYSGKDIEAAGITYVILTEDNILAILDEEAT